MDVQEAHRSLMAFYSLPQSSLVVSYFPNQIVDLYDRMFHQKFYQNDKSIDRSVDKKFDRPDQIALLAAELDLFVKCAIRVISGQLAGQEVPVAQKSYPWGRVYLLPNSLSTLSTFSPPLIENYVAKLNKALQRDCKEADTLHVTLTKQNLLDSAFAPGEKYLFSCFILLT
jgi:hypothetical protein